MAYTVHRPSDPPVRGTRVVVPPIHSRFFRRRTTHEPDEEKRPLTMGDGGGTSLPNLEKGPRLRSDPGVPRL